MGRRNAERGEDDAHHQHDPACRHGHGGGLNAGDLVRAATKFDGNWSLVVYTRSGPCDASYRFAGQIANSAVVYGGGSVQVYGRVRPNGAVSLRVSRGSAYAVGSGHLTATHGAGSWYGVASGGRCSGSWVATRG
jgi:hypothetical protein